MSTSPANHPLPLDRRVSELSPEKRRYLEQLLQRQQRGAAGQGAIPRRRRAETAPLSYAQQRLWLVCQLTQGGAFYNETFSIRIRWALDVPAFERSINEIIRRHELLRTGFRMEDGTPVQMISPGLRLRLDVIDLTATPLARREVQAQEIIRAEALKPFDLNRDIPFMRVALIRMSPQDHVFLLTMHHIICDGWSMGVFSAELAALYEAFSQGRPSPLPELAIQYADYAVWQRNTLSGDSLDVHLGYWLKQLAGAPTLDLPTDRPRPAIQSYAGARVMIVIPPRVHAGLTQLSMREGVTLFVTLLAAFKVLLQRYCGQDDIVLGVPVANRTRAELEPLIGFFVNTLVMRSDLAGNPTFRELIARVRTVVTGAFAHADVPFEKLVEELHPERDLSRTPLFQVAFQLFASLGLGGEPGAENSLELDSVEIGTSKFDLRFDLYETPRGLDGHLEYCTDLFDRATIERMAGHYQTLLASAVANPDARIGDMPLLTPAEEHVLACWSRTQADYDRDICVHTLVEAAARQAPDAAAVVAREGQLTYGELDRRAGLVATHLRTLGVGPDVPVACCFERSLDMVVALLGVLKAGGAYLPLDPAHPRERLAFMLEDAQCAALLTHTRARGRLPEGIPHLAIDAVSVGEWEQMAAVPAGAVPPPDAGRLAYVIYTSGSTGQPRGVEIAHRSLMNLVAWHQREYRPAPGDLATLLAGPGFDASVWELWPYLSAGATIHIPDEATLAVPAELWRWLAAERITHCFLPTPLAEMMLEETLPDGLALKVLLTGGDRLHNHPQHALPFRFVNHYGPTENSVVATAGDVPTAGGALVPSIGRAISNVRTHVLDDAGRVLPIGVPGELYLGGESLARGYRHRRALTAERFIPDPFARQSGARLYRTGDVVRYRTTGELEFLGRNDRQVKLRGYRVELGEIEATLRLHPRVADGVVEISESPGGERQLTGYVVLRHPQEPAPGGGHPLVSERIAKWHALYDETYRPASAVLDDPTFNLVGWNSSYTDAPLPAEDLREQVEQTVARVLACRPGRVLEIGCGTGLLLLRLAPHCRRYVGTDFSRAALDYVRAQLNDPSFAHVELIERLADDLDDLAADSFDAVVLNSIVQYFPGVDYLTKVLCHAARMVAPGGHIFVGDVRNLNLLGAFHTGVELFQAPASMPVGDLRQRVRRRMTQEQELVVDPAYFVAFRQSCPRIGAVEVALKRGHCRNELTAYRYDAILAVGAAPAPRGPVRELDWQALGSLAALRAALQDGHAGPTRVRGVPNQRVVEDVRAHDLLDSPQAPATCRALKMLAMRGADAVDPESVWRLGEDLGFDARIGYAAASEAVDVLFVRPSDDRDDGRYEVMDWGVPPRSDGDRSRLTTTDPLAEDDRRAVLADLRDYLRARLPDYMIPANFVVLTSLPLTPNGKVDRRALPGPDQGRPDLASDYVAPRTRLEREIARLWQEVLGIDSVGIHDNFFDLGGHSLLIVRLHSRLTEALGVALALTDLFQRTTVSALARHLADGAGEPPGNEVMARAPGSQAGAGETPSGG